MIAFVVDYSYRFTGLAWHESMALASGWHCWCT